MTRARRNDPDGRVRGIAPGISHTDGSTGHCSDLHRCGSSAWDPMSPLPRPAAGALSADERRRASAWVLLNALDVLQAATEDVSPELVIPHVRRAVAALDDDQVRAVAVALAVEAVWRFPLALVEPEYAGNIRRRVRQVRAWVQRMRLEASWVVS